MNLILFLGLETLIATTGVNFPRPLGDPKSVFAVIMIVVLAVLYFAGGRLGVA